ncbi:MAG TPA: alpha amylase C-terminal domain-containing protein [Bacteroidales bacterium]|nr:alpha amylase C-terminal domain-containing protein [Bacteroidales bacterium]
MSQKTPVIVQNDTWLAPFRDIIVHRNELVNKKIKKLAPTGSLKDFALGHLFYGLHKQNDVWVFREWAPNATEIYLVGDFSKWLIDKQFALRKIGNGNWQLEVPSDYIRHGQQYKLLVKWSDGEGYRLPSYANRVVQDEATKIFNAQVWMPDKAYQWKNNFIPSWDFPLIYEAHVGMSSEEPKVSTFREFENNVLPRIKKLGYNALQLMAIQEHPYYGSFGYHVSNFFAVSSRFGTPDDLKSLIDKAHEMGIAVIMDLVHSHAVKNVLEGLGLFDGNPGQYFHTNDRRIHKAWDSLCFDYGKNEVLHFLLSNCQYWLAEYRIDGFRFDGVTSMLYYDHGLGKDFTNYNQYYDGNQDEDAIVYLSLANELIHSVNPNAITIAEEMSGMPGLAAPLAAGGIGFDFRLAMGIPDYWIKIIKELPDEQWNVSQMYFELSNHRSDERAISYTESHDQALVGDKTIIFRLADKEMYTHMSKFEPSLVIDRAIALHKMARLFTISTAGSGYLNFMGNEFGHPEWIDFPREGNRWSYQYARRQWSLADNSTLKYEFLNDFDASMIDFISKAALHKASFPTLNHADEKNQVISFERNEFVFVFNFNPSQSFTDYNIPVHPGKYQIVFSTDDPEFGGFNRIDKSYIFYATAGKEITTLKSNAVTLYIPSRTAFVLKMLPTKSVY